MSVNDDGLNQLQTFICKLAIELHMSVTEVLNLPASEIWRWQRYFSEHLFTTDREEYQLAMIALLLHKAHFQGDVELKDYIPRIKHQDTEEELITKLEMLRSVIGSEVKNDNRT